MRRIWTIARRLRKAATVAERQLWLGLRGRQLGGFRFRRQFPVGGFPTAFACVEARLVVDIDADDGDAHALHAAVRLQKLELCGYRVLRFSEGDVLARSEDVLDEILRQAHASPTGRCGRVAVEVFAPEARCPHCGA
jgi:very-short-patch-repair endonuclease